MTSFTPQAIVDELHASDRDLEECAKQWAWFKGQKDHWKDVLDVYRAHKAIIYTGPATKAKDYALDAAGQELVQIPWMTTEARVSIVDMVRITESSFDLISKRYNQLETHIGILQSVNKNIMQDYARAGANEWAS
jgi:hypothetical protein